MNKNEEVNSLTIQKDESENSSKVNSLNALRQWQKYKQAVEFRKQTRQLI